MKPIEISISQQMEYKSKSPHSSGMRLPQADTVVTYYTIHWSSRNRGNNQTLVISTSEASPRTFRTLGRLMSLSSRELNKVLRSEWSTTASSSSTKRRIRVSSFRFSQEVRTHQLTRMATAAQSEPARLRVGVLECWKHIKQNAARNEIIL